MWVCLSGGFLSIVAHRDKPGVLLVRARRPGDIARVFPGVSELRTPRADYLYRAEVTVEAVQEAMAREVAAIAYPNFKSSVPDPELAHAYGRCWGELLAVQR